MTTVLTTTWPQPLLSSSSSNSASSLLSASCWSGSMGAVALTECGHGWPVWGRDQMASVSSVKASESRCFGSISTPTAGTTAPSPESPPAGSETPRNRTAVAIFDQGDGASAQPARLHPPRCNSPDRDRSRPTPTTSTTSSSQLVIQNLSRPAGFGPVATGAVRARTSSSLRRCSPPSLLSCQRRCGS